MFTGIIEELGRVRAIERRAGGARLEIAAETEDESRNALTFRKDSGELVKAVDEALAELRKDGTLTEISEKYFGEDVSH